MSELSADQRRVGEYIVEISDNTIGMGADPIGFLIASHAALREQLRRAHEALDTYGVARGAAGHSVRYRIGLLVESLEAK